MAIEKQHTVDEITVTENGAIYYREAVKFIENDKVVQTTYHRSSVSPGQDISDIPQKVKEMCAFVWKL
jgi:hypothetical protein